MGKKILLKRVVVLFMLVLLFSELAPVPYPIRKEAYDFVVAFIPDLHVGFLGSSGRTARALYKASQEADYLLLGGDLTDNHLGLEEEFVWLQELLNEYASIPILSVPGNHDNPELFQKYFGELMWIREIGGYRLVGINSRNRKPDLGFLRKALETDGPVILFAHHNVELLLNKTEVQALIEENQNIVVWASGHLHFQWERINSHEIVYLQGGWGWLGQYQLLCFKDGKLAKIVLR